MKNGNVVMVVIAITLSVIGLLVAIGAYNRAGGNIQREAVTRFETAAEELEDKVEEGGMILDEVTDDADLTSALNSLKSIRDHILAENVSNETYELIEQIEMSIKRAYEDEGNIGKQMILRWQTDLNQLRQLLESNLSLALTKVNSLINALENDN